ncbi:hypothetical protein ACM66B_006069 [Microbotryomycetes sp. NB124-2]
MASALTTTSTDENAPPARSQRFVSPFSSASKRAGRAPRPSLSSLVARQTNKQQPPRARTPDKRQLLRAGSVEIDIQLPTSDGHQLEDDEHAFADEHEPPEQDDDDSSSSSDSDHAKHAAQHMLPTPPTSQSPTKMVATQHQQLHQHLSLPPVATRLRSRSPSTQPSTAKIFNVYQPPPLRRKSAGKPKTTRKTMTADVQIPTTSQPPTASKQQPKSAAPTASKKGTTAQLAKPVQATSSDNKPRRASTTTATSTAKTNKKTSSSRRRSSAAAAAAAAVRKPSPTETLPEPTGEGSDGDDPLLLKDPEELREFGEGRPLWVRARSRSQSLSVARMEEEEFDSDEGQQEGQGRYPERNESAEQEESQQTYDQGDDLGGYEVPIDYSDGPYQFYPQGGGDSDSDDGGVERNDVDCQDESQYVNVDDEDEADESEAEEPELEQSEPATAAKQHRGGRLMTEEPEEAEGDSQDVTVVLDISTDSVPYPEREYEVAIAPLSSSPIRPELDRRRQELDRRPSPFLLGDERQAVDPVQELETSDLADKDAVPLPPVPREVVWTRGPAFFRSSPSSAASPARNSLRILTPPKSAPPTPPKQLESAQQQQQPSASRARSSSMTMSEAPSSPSVRRSKSSTAMSDVSMSSPARAGSIMDVLMNSPSPIKRVTLTANSSVPASPMSRLYPQLPPTSPSAALSSNDLKMASPNSVKKVTTTTTTTTTTTASVPGSLERLRIGGIVQAGRDTLSRLLFGKMSPKPAALRSVATFDAVVYADERAETDNFDSQDDEDEGVASVTADEVEVGEQDDAESLIHEEQYDGDKGSHEQAGDDVVNESEQDDEDETGPASEVEDELEQLKDDEAVTESRLTPVPSRLSLPLTTYGRPATSTISRHTPRSTTGAPIVSVSSTDPKAAARAAAILKVYHDYVDQGLEVPESVLRDVGIRRSAVKGRYVGRAEAGRELIQEAVEDLIASPRGLVVAIAAADEVEQQQQQQQQQQQEDSATRDGAWSTKDWRRLESVLVDEAKRSRSRSVDVDPSAVVKRFLEDRGEGKDAGAEWSREMLTARVQAIQKRRAQDANKRIADQSILDSTSSVRYRTLEDELAAFERDDLHDPTASYDEQDDNQEDESEDDEQGYNVEDDTFFERARPSGKMATVPALASDRFSHLYEGLANEPAGPVSVKHLAESESVPTETVPTSPVKKVASYLSSFISRTSSPNAAPWQSAVASTLSAQPPMSERRPIAPLRTSASTQAPQPSTPAAPTPPVASPFVRQASSAPRAHVLAAAQRFTEQTSRRRQTLALLDKRRRSSLLLPGADGGEADESVRQDDLVGGGKVWDRVTQLEEAESSREEEQARVLELMGSLKESTTTTSANGEGSSTVKRKASWTVGKSPVRSTALSSNVFVGSARGLRRTSAGSVTGSGAQTRSSGAAGASASRGTPVAFVPSGTRALDRTMTR